MLYNIAFQHWKAYVFTPVFPLLVDALLFLTPSLYKLPKQQERRRKNTPFFVPFRSFHSWINTLQTVCNGTNGRHATLQRSDLHPIPLFSPSSRPPSPSTDPPPNTHHQTKFFSNFFSQKIFHLIKWNIHPLLKFFLKNFSLYKKRGIYHQSEIFLIMFSHYAFSSTRQNKQWNPKKNLRSNLYPW